MERKGDKYGRLEIIYCENRDGDRSRMPSSLRAISFFFPICIQASYSSQNDKRNGLIPISQLEPDKMRENNIRAKDKMTPEHMLSSLLSAIE